MRKEEFDVIVVGSGFGGATIAREMNRLRRSVFLIERGGNRMSLDNTLPMAMVIQWVPLILSKQGNVVMCTSNYGNRFTGNPVLTKTIR
jgi:choline dehydrogenase-like flavoprotein